MYHPECKKNEVWVGNTNANGIPDKIKNLKTARLGEQAFDIHGKKIDRTYMLPLFIGVSEESQYDRIMMGNIPKI